MRITTKHACDSRVMFVTHKCFAFLFFPPFRCVNSLLTTEVQSRGARVVTGRRIEGKLPFIFLILVTPYAPFGHASWGRVKDGAKIGRSDLSWFSFRPLTHCSTPGGEGVLNEVLHVEVLSRGPTPYPFAYLLLTNCTPFRYIIYILFRSLHTLWML